MTPHEHYLVAEELVDRATLEFNVLISIAIEKFSTLFRSELDGLEIDDEIKQIIKETVEEGLIRGTEFVDSLTGMAQVHAILANAPSGAQRMNAPNVDLRN